MIIKTTINLNPPTGTIVSGVSFRAKRERDGYRINSGEHTGLFVPASAAFVLEDIEYSEDGRKRKSNSYVS